MKREVNEFLIFLVYLFFLNGKIVYKINGSDLTKLKYKSCLMTEFILYKWLGKKYENLTEITTL